MGQSYFRAGQTLSEAHTVHGDVKSNGNSHIEGVRYGFGVWRSHVVQDASCRARSIRSVSESYYFNDTTGIR